MDNLTRFLLLTTDQGRWYQSSDSGSGNFNKKMGCLSFDKKEQCECEVKWVFSFSFFVTFFLSFKTQQTNSFPDQEDQLIFSWWSENIVFW